LLNPTHWIGVSRFHRVRLRTMTKITGTTRNSNTPIRLGVRKRKACGPGGAGRGWTPSSSLDVSR